MYTPGQFSEGTKRLLQRHPASPAERTRELAADFTAAQGAACRRLSELGYPLERMIQELQSGHLPFFREGADRDRKRSSGTKASYRFAGLTPGHVEEWRRRRREVVDGTLTATALVEWEGDFLLHFTFEVIEQVARRVSPLPAGRSADAGLQAALTRARSLRDEILGGNLLLVAKLVIARARFHQQAVWDDLFTAGIDGLMIAIHRYDPSVGQFSTYATPWVTMAIDRFVAKTRYVIRVPVGMQEKVRRERRAAREAGVEPAANPIPEVQSLEEPLGSADQELSLQDVVADPTTARPREAAEQADIAQILQDRLRQLDLLKQFVIAMRSDVGDAAALAAKLFRIEAALSLGRGRAIATGAVQAGERPARVRLIDAPPSVPVPVSLPDAAPLPEGVEEWSLAV